MSDVQKFDKLLESHSGEITQILDHLGSIKSKDPDMIADALEFLHLIYTQAITPDLAELMYNYNLLNDGTLNVIGALEQKLNEYVARCTPYVTQYGAKCIPQKMKMVIGNVWMGATIWMDVHYQNKVYRGALSRQFERVNRFNMSQDSVEGFWQCTASIMDNQPESAFMHHFKKVNMESLLTAIECYNVFAPASATKNKTLYMLGIHNVLKQFAESGHLIERTHMDAILDFIKPRETYTDVEGSIYKTYVGVFGVQFLGDMVRIVPESHPLFERKELLDKLVQ